MQERHDLWTRRVAWGAGAGQSEPGSLWNRGKAADKRLLLRRSQER